MISVKELKEWKDSEINIKDWLHELICFNPVSSFLRRVGRFILRLFRWIPVLWNQEEWDFEYIYDILELKMKELRNNICQDAHHTKDCIDEQLQQIDSCLDHLDKFRNWTNYIEFPDEQVEFVPTENDCYTMSYSDKYRASLEKGRKFEDKHYKAFWREFVKYHNNWWT